MRLLSGSLERVLGQWREKGVSSSGAPTETASDHQYERFSGESYTRERRIASQ